MTSNIQHNQNEITSKYSYGTWIYTSGMVTGECSSTAADSSTREGY